MSRRPRFELESVDESQIRAETLGAAFELAREIASEANRAIDAPAGIRAEKKEDHALVGPTGAAGLPYEIGTRFQPASRIFKRLIDSRRIK